jgi:hypothetical protein
MKITTKILALVAFGASVSAAASELSLIVGSKPGGSMHEMSKELSTFLTNKNYKVNWTAMGDCKGAQTALQNSKSPSVTIVYNAFITLPGCEEIASTPKLFVKNIASFPLLVCGKEDRDFRAIVSRKEKATVAAIKSHASKIITDLNPSFVYVPYTNSGAALKGYMAGDTDFIMTTMSVASQVSTLPNTRCFVTTGDQQVLGARVASKEFPQWKYNRLQAALAIVQVNHDAQQLNILNKAIDEFLVSNIWKNYTSKSQMNIDSSITVEEFVFTGKMWRQEQ